MYYIGSMQCDPNYLKHHGVPGQQKGVRRYQNEDGSLTPLGREHYGVGERRYQEAVDDDHSQKEVTGDVFQRSLARNENRTNRRITRMIDKRNKLLEANAGIENKKTENMRGRIIYEQERRDFQKDARKAYAELNPKEQRKIRNSIRLGRAIAAVNLAAFVGSHYFGALARVGENVAQNGHLANMLAYTTWGTFGGGLASETATGIRVKRMVTDYREKNKK